MLNTRELLALYNVFCMQTDMSGMYCYSDLMKQFELGLDFSCAQMHGLECCLPSFRHFQAKCNSSGIWSPVFNATTLAHIDDISARCGMTDTPKCLNYNVEPLEDGNCHVLISEMSSALSHLGASMITAVLGQLVALLIAFVVYL